MSSAVRLPRKRLLKNALPQVPGEEEAVGTAAAEGGQEPKLRYPDVLGLVDHCEVEGWVLRIAHLPRQPLEDARLRREATGKRHGSPTASRATVWDRFWMTGQR